MTPLAPANVTNYDLYVKLVELDAKVEVLVLANCDKETRVRSLERWKAYVTGIAIASSWIFTHAFKQ